MKTEPIATDIPDADALAHELARVRAILRDVIAYLGDSGIGTAMMDHFKHRLDEGP